jgi:cell shape-determining protein MreD
MSKRIISSLITLFSFVSLSFISVHGAICVFYCFVFASDIGERDDEKFFTIFVMSLFLDIYTSGFIGMSFMSIIIILIIESTFRTILRNISIFLRTCYFFLVLCISKTVSFVIIFISGNQIDLLEHISQIFLAAATFCAYHLVKNVFLLLRDEYAHRQ